MLKYTRRYIDQVIKICSFLLFFYQVYAAYNIYFLTGWDVGGDVIPAARLLASGDIQGFLETSTAYFSRYPNNIPMTSFFAWLLRLNADIGIWGKQDELMSILMVNCLINTLTCFLTYKIIKTLQG